MKYYNPNREDNYEIIRDNAIELFYRQGYAKTTLRQVAEASGIKHSTVLYYYKNKENLARFPLIRYFNGLNHYTQKILQSQNKSPAKTEEELFYLNRYLHNSLHYKWLSQDQSFSKYFIEFYYAAKDTFRVTIDDVEKIVFETEGRIVREKSTVKTGLVGDPLIQKQLIMQLTPHMDIMLVESLQDEQITYDQAAIFFTKSIFELRHHPFTEADDVLLQYSLEIGDPVEINLYEDILTRQEFDRICNT